MTWEQANRMCTLRQCCRHCRDQLICHHCNIIHRGARLGRPRVTGGEIGRWQVQSLELECRNAQTLVAHGILTLNSLSASFMARTCDTQLERGLALRQE